jgi:polar amino acid transport system substrate-binding protein
MQDLMRIGGPHGIRPVSLVSLLGVLVLAACDLPRDPSGTTEKVRGGELVVGLVKGSTYASFEDGLPKGEEVDVVNAIADEMGAVVQWIPGTGHQVFTMMEHDQINLAIGGIPSSTPWKTYGGLTAAVGKITLHDETHDRIFVVPMGENEWLLKVNRMIRRMTGKAG